MTTGFEWPAPDARKCGAVAEDRASGEQISCLLRPGHRAPEHHWEEIRGDELRSASWIGDGPVTYIGPGTTNSQEQPQP